MSANTFLEHAVLSFKRIDESKQRYSQLFEELYLLRNCVLDIRYETFLLCSEQLLRNRTQGDEEVRALLLGHIEKQLHADMII